MVISSVTMVTKSCKSNVLLSNVCLTYLSARRTLACRTPWNVQLALFIAMVTRLITIVTKVITNLHMSTKQHKVLATQATIQVGSHVVSIVCFGSELELRRDSDDQRGHPAK